MQQQTLVIAVLLTCLALMKDTIGLPYLDYFHILLLLVLFHARLRIHELRQDVAACNQGAFLAARAGTCDAPRIESAAVSSPAVTCEEHPLRAQGKENVKRFMATYGPLDSGGGVDEAVFGTSEWPVFLKTEVEHAVVHRKSNAKLCFRICMELPASAAAVFTMLTTADVREEWDMTMASIRIVEQLDEWTSVVHYCTKAQWPTSARDLVMLSHQAKLPKGGYLNVTSSMDHPAVPEQRGVVRAHIDLAGELVLPISDKRCRLMLIHSVDPKGMLPESIVAVALKQSQAISMSQLHRLADALPPMADYVPAPVRNAPTSSATGGSVPKSAMTLSAAPTSSTCPPEPPRQQIVSTRQHVWSLFRKGYPVLVPLLALSIMLMRRRRR